MKGTRIYNIWQNIKQRCRNKNNPRYKKYSKVGVCDSWYDSFDAFYSDMGEPPTKYHSIDRIDNRKGYYKENCRWATPVEQVFNRELISGGNPHHLGVSSTGKLGHFQARIKIEKKEYYIGVFKTQKDAHLEYVRVYKEWFGNIPPYHNCIYCNNEAILKEK